MFLDHMSDKDYFVYDALDQTMLKKFIVSPRNYKYYKDHPSQPTAAMRFGSAAHSLVLGSGPSVIELPNARTKAGREEIAEISARGDIPLNPDDYEAVHRMADITAPYFKALKGKSEVAMISEPEPDESDAGFEIKGKADYLCSCDEDSESDYLIYDYKTTSADPTDFAIDAFRYQYYFQAAFYFWLLAALCPTVNEKPRIFTFVVQQKVPPYDYAVWDLEEFCEEIEIERLKISIALRHYQQCLQNPVMFNEGLDKRMRTLAMSSWQINLEKQDVQRLELLTDPSEYSR